MFFGLRREVRRRLSGARRLSVASQILMAQRMLAIECDARSIGFFAQLSLCLKVFRHADQRSLIPAVRLISENFRDPTRGDDWLAYYFTNPALEAVEPPPSAASYIRIRDAKELPSLTGAFDLQDANAMFARYARPRPDHPAARSMPHRCLR